MRNDLKTSMGTQDEISLIPVSEKTREKHMAESHVYSLRNFTLKQRKKEASKPIYLVRYE